MDDPCSSRYRLAADTAWPGLMKLTSLDPSLAFERTDRDLTLRRDQVVVQQLPRPLDSDPRGWGAATSGDPELARFAARMMYSKAGSSPVEEAG